MIRFNKKNFSEIRLFSSFYFVKYYIETFSESTFQKEEAFTGNIRDKRDITTVQVDFCEPDPKSESTVYPSENWVEVVTTTRREGNNIAKYRRISGDRFVDSSTGEVREYQRNLGEPVDASKFKRNFDELRRTICSNVRGKGAELHITLTVRPELSADFEAIYNYFTGFRKKLQYHYPDFEYIAIAEPHETGRYHLHVVLVSHGDIPVFLSNSEIAKMWDAGFTRTTRITDSDKIAGYFCSMEKRKAWAEFYCPRRRLFRCSKGIVRPKPLRMTGEEVSNYVKEEGLCPARAYRYVVKKTQADGSTQTVNVVTREQFRRG